jgi:hypothetical protein
MQLKFWKKPKPEENSVYRFKDSEPVTLKISSPVKEILRALIERPQTFAIINNLKRTQKQTKGQELKYTFNGTTWTIVDRLTGLTVGVDVGFEKRQHQLVGFSKHGLDLTSDEKEALLTAGERWLRLRLIRHDLICRARWTKRYNNIRSIISIV